MSDHRGIGRSPIGPWEAGLFGLLTGFIIAALLLPWAEEKVSEPTNPSAQASIDHYRNLMWEADKRAERAEDRAGRYAQELYARGVLILPTIEVER